MPLALPYAAMCTTPLLPRAPPAPRAQNSTAVSKLLLHTTEHSSAKLDGYVALMNVLKSNSSVTDLTLAKNPNVRGGVRGSGQCAGWCVLSAGQSAACMCLCVCAPGMVRGQRARLA